MGERRAARSARPSSLPLGSAAAQVLGKRWMANLTESTIHIAKEVRAGARLSGDAS